MRFHCGVSHPALRPCDSGTRTVFGELARDRFGCGDDALVFGRQKADERNAQERGIERLAVKGLNEDAALVVHAARADLAMDLVAERAPPVYRSFQPMALGGFDGAIEGDPRHHGRMSMALFLAAAFPDAGIRQLPMRLEVLEEHRLHVQRIVFRLDAVEASRMERVHDLAE